MKIMQSSPRTSTQGAPPEQHKLINRKKYFDYCNNQLKITIFICNFD
jgi:hypothetical protein